MAKNNKRKVDTFVHEKSGIEIECFAEGTRFMCTVLEEEMSEGDASVLRHRVFDKLEHWMKMEWHGIIEVSCEKDEKNYYYRDDRPDLEGSIKLTAKRYYLSRSPAGRVVKCDWETDEEHRKAKLEKFGGADLQLTRLPLKAPFNTTTSRRDDPVWLLNYDESLWATIEGMIESLHQMRERLNRMFKTKDGILQLQGAGQKLLLGPGKAK